MLLWVCINMYVYMYIYIYRKVRKQVVRLSYCDTFFGPDSTELCPRTPPELAPRRSPTLATASFLQPETMPQGCSFGAALHGLAGLGFKVSRCVSKGAC